MIKFFSRQARDSGFIFCFFLYCFQWQTLQAQQVNDLESWHNVGVSMDLTRSFNLTVKYIVGNRDNMSRFSRSYFSLQGDKDLTSWLRLGAEYRYATSYEKDFSRFWLYAVAEYKLSKKWRLQYRPLLQYDVDYFDKEYLEYHTPYAVTRNMLRLKYRYSKKMQWYGYADIYHSWKNREVKPYRMRYGLGISYLYKKRHDMGAEYVYIDEFNKKQPWDVMFLNFKYIYHLRMSKNKKEHHPIPVY